MATGQVNYLLDERPSQAQTCPAACPRGSGGTRYRSERPSQAGPLAPPLVARASTFNTCPCPRTTGTPPTGRGTAPSPATTRSPWPVPLNRPIVLRRDLCFRAHLALQSITQRHRATELVLTTSRRSPGSGAASFKIDRFVPGAPVPTPTAVKQRRGKLRFLTLPPDRPNQARLATSRARTGHDL